MTVRKYRRKPFDIEAVRYTGKNLDEVSKFVHSCNGCTVYMYPNLLLMISTPRDELLKVYPLDWVLKGMHSEVTVVTRQNFEACYERIEAQ